MVLYKIKECETSLEKNRIHPVKVGKGVRMSFARQKEVLEMPNLIEDTDEFLPVVLGRRTERSVPGYFPNC